MNTKIKYVTTLNPSVSFDGLTPETNVSFAPMECVKQGFMEYRTIEYSKYGSSYNCFMENDVLLAKVTPCFENGNISIATGLENGIGFGSSELYILRANGIEVKYLFYMLQSNEFRQLAISSMQGAGGLKRVPADVLRNHQFYLPPYNVQNATILHLSKKTAQIDHLIDEKEKLIELLKEERQSIISEAVTKGLDSSVPMKDSGVEWLGEIPAHWTVLPAKALFMQSKETVRFGDEQLTASQKYGILTQRDYMERENAKIVLADKGLESWKHVEPNDFIISLRSFQGGIEISYVSGCITWHYIVLKPRTDVYPDYFKWLFKSPRYIQALQRTANFIRDGQDLRFTNFVQVSLPALSLDEQRNIATHLNMRTTQIDEIIGNILAQITLLKEYRQSIISEAVTGKYIVPVANSVSEEKPIKHANLHFKRRVLAAKILDELCEEPTLGHVKMEKMLFLSEYCGQLDLHTQYDRHAAGPYNPKVLRSIDSQLKKSKWFSYSPSSDKSNKYTRMTDSQKYTPYYESYFGDEQRSTIDRLVHLFRTARTIQCEIVATLYGAWNDFLLEGKPPSDAQIINEVLSNWHEEKERISYERWQDALNWMRANAIIPIGYGESTKGGSL